MFFNKTTSTESILKPLKKETFFSFSWRKIGIMFLLLGVALIFLEWFLENSLDCNFNIICYSLFPLRSILIMFSVIFLLPLMAYTSPILDHVQNPDKPVLVYRIFLSFFIFIEFLYLYLLSCLLSRWIRIKFRNLYIVLGIIISTSILSIPFSYLYWKLLPNGEFNVGGITLGGYPVAYLFSLVFLFTAFGGQRKGVWMGILSTPAILFVMAFDLEYIFFPIIAGIIGWWLGLRVEKRLKILQKS